MADYLLDTNLIWRWYYKGHEDHQRVVERVERAKQPDDRTGYISRFYVSVVTHGEIAYGRRVNPPTDKTQESDYYDFIEREMGSPLEISRYTVAPYSELRAWLFEKQPPKGRRGKKFRVEEVVDMTTGKALGVQENDLWIVAQAAALNLVLVTADKMTRLKQAAAAVTPDLRIENWAKSETTR